MFYVLLVIELALLLAVVVALWTKVIAYFPSHDVRWLFGGTTCLGAVGLAAATGLVYFRRLSLPSPFNGGFLVHDDSAKLRTFATSVTVMVVVVTTIVIGLKRSQSGLLTPSRARSWRYRKLTGVAFAISVVIAATVVLHDRQCVQQLALWRADGVLMLEDLAKRYPSNDPRPTLVGAVDDIWRRDGLSDDLLQPYIRAINDNKPLPKFPEQGLKLLGFLQALPATRPDGVADWLDPDREPTLNTDVLGKVEDVVCWRLASAEHDDFWELSSLWSEIAERLAIDPAPHYRGRVLGMERRMSGAVLEAVTARPELLRAFDAGVWNVEPKYLKALPDHYHWLRARNLLQIYDAGVGRTIPEDHYDLLIFSNGYVQRAIPGPSVGGLWRRMWPGYWELADGFTAGLSVYEPVIKLAPEDVSRHLIREQTNGSATSRSLYQNAHVDEMEWRLAPIVYRRVFRTLVACLAFAIKHGRPPDALTDLVPEYAASVPVDPYSDRPLGFRRNGNRFRVYSVWRDYSDEGGAVGSQSAGTDLGFEYSVGNGRIAAIP